MGEEANREPIWDEEELDKVSARAENLTEEQLYDLVTLTGIEFEGIDSRKKASELTKDQYIDVLDEVDDKNKVYKFLEEHGV